MICGVDMLIVKKMFSDFVESLMVWGDEVCIGVDEWVWNVYVVVV